MISIDRIAALLTERPVASIEAGNRARAAVACILCEKALGPEILFILRAAHEDDPWSGDIGFPGGKLDEAKRESPQLAVQRETLEEIGLDLNITRYLGRLDDISGAHLPIVVSCFVYGLRTPPRFTLNREVADAFWVPISDLIAPDRHQTSIVSFRGTTFERPSIPILGPGNTVLWGITYRLVLQLLQRLGD